MDIVDLTKADGRQDGAGEAASAVSVLADATEA